MSHLKCFIAEVWDLPAGTAGSTGQGLEGAAVLPPSGTCLLAQPGLGEAPERGECHGEVAEAGASREACEARQLLESARPPQVAFLSGTVFILSNCSGQSEASLAGCVGFRVLG